MSIVEGLNAPPGYVPPAFSSLMNAFQIISRYAVTLRSKSQFKSLVYLNPPLVGVQKEAIQQQLLVLENLPLPTCHVCKSCDSSCRLHACLHCVFLGCWSQSHIQDHSNTNAHVFFVDFTHGTLYCSKCKDYVYDLDFERIQSQESKRWNLILQVLQSGSRQTGQVWNPNSMEIQLIQKHSSLSKCHGIKGLRNLGATCFMNVILQCFVHNPYIRNYFLGNQHSISQCSISMCLSCEMTRLFQNMYNGSNAPFGPVNFLLRVWTVSKSLAGYSQQDAHEFFISVLNQIHNNLTFKHSTVCDCIIHKTFSGVLQSNLTCLGCGNTNTTLDPFLDISLELKRQVLTDQAKSRIQNVSKTLNRPFDLCLLDCLEKFTHPEDMHYNCQHCNKKHQEATKQLSIKTFPLVLSFQIKSYEHDTDFIGTKLESPIYIPLEIDLNPFATNPQEYGNSCKYSLFALVNHQGKLDTGHYTSFAKSGGQWFQFDDQTVTLVDAKDINTGHA